MLKKLFVWVFSIILLVFSFIPTAFCEENDVFQYYALFDGVSGQIIEEKGSGEIVENSGLAQLMSILIFAENIENGVLARDEKVTVSANAAAIGGSTVFLEEGDSYTAEDLFKSCVIVAANDACVALCERIAGSEEKFVEMMNDKVAEIGMKDTIYTDPTGFKSEGEKTTAYDQCLLAAELVKHPIVLEFSGVWTDMITHEGGRVSDMVNANKGIAPKGNLDGIGVGSSAQSGYSIAATKRKGDNRYIFVGIGAQNPKERYGAAENMLNTAFDNYTTKQFLAANQIVKKDYEIDGANKKTIVLYAKEDIKLLLKKADAENCETRININEEIILPIKKGDKIGEYYVILNGKTIGKSDIVSGENLFEKSFSYAINCILKDWLY